MTRHPAQSLKNEKSRLVREHKHSGISMIKQKSRKDGRDNLDAFAVLPHRRNQSGTSPESVSMTTEQLPISVIIMTNNEEANIGHCLDTVVGWAQEVFVVDSGSRDRTLDIVAKYTKNIVHHPFENY